MRDWLKNSFEPLLPCDLNGLVWRSLKRQPAADRVSTDYYIIMNELLNAFLGVVDEIPEDEKQDIVSINMKLCAGKDAGTFEGIYSNCEEVPESMKGMLETDFGHAFWFEASGNILRQYDDRLDSMMGVVDNDYLAGDECRSPLVTKIEVRVVYAILAPKTFMPNYKTSELIYDKLRPKFEEIAKRYLMYFRKSKSWKDE